MLQSSWEFEIFQENAAKWGSLWLWIFLRWTARKEGSIFLKGCDLHRNYGVVVISLSFLCNYDNLTLKLHQEKRSYPDEGWIFIGRFKVGSVPGMSVAREAKSITHSWSPRKLINFTLFNSSYWRKMLAR